MPRAVEASETRVSDVADAGWMPARLKVQKEVRMVFSRKTGIRTEVKILSLRKKRHSKHGSNREQEGEWFEKIHL